MSDHVLEKLSELGRLRAAGVIDDSEFARLKAEILAHPALPAASPRETVCLALRDMGLQPEIDQDGDITFGHRGLLVEVDLEHDGSTSMSLVCDPVWEIRSPAERERARDAVERINAGSRMARLLTHPEESDVIAVVQGSVVRTPELNQHLGRMLDSLTDCVATFRGQMRDPHPTTVVAEWDELHVEARELGMAAGRSIVSNVVGSPALLRAAFVANQTGPYVEGGEILRHGFEHFAGGPAIEGLAGTDREWAERALEEIRTELLAHGWEQQASGPHWYSYRFRRRAQFSEGGPQTTWLTAAAGGGDGPAPDSKRPASQIVALGLVGTAAAVSLVALLVALGAGGDDGVIWAGVGLAIQLVVVVVLYRSWEGMGRAWRVTTTGVGVLALPLGIIVAGLVIVGLVIWMMVVSLASMT
ncbi:SHOCT domain-containing protein [Actinomycetospora aeridis]|uniref:SHOCT domain-containing protein n=1 Tax=Actinomycetospora aeridis TaxID=3129231 RepID=A0ABU8N1R4_9PSEU